MKIKHNLLIALLLIVYGAKASASNDAYVGIGVANIDQDAGNSLNISLTAGFDFYQRNFQESSFQSLTIGGEAQYSVSVSGENSTKYYSMFIAQRLYTSELYYLKLKQGITRFPDTKITAPDTERSHIGLGIGLGYKLNTGAIEVEYIYSNKTLHASALEINYKYRF